MMSVQTREFVDVAARSRDLGCRVPARTALLPANFAAALDVGEFIFNPATPYIRSAWKSVGLEDEGPSGTGVGDLGSGVSSEGRTPAPSPQSLAPSETGLQLLAPSASAKVPLVAFFGSGLLTGPEWSLAVALGLVSRVIALHPACASPWEVRFDAVVERPGERVCACIEYQGDAFGIVELARDVRRIWAGK